MQKQRDDWGYFCGSDMSNSNGKVDIVWCISQLFHCWDKRHDTLNLKVKRFILSHGCRSFSPWSAKMAQYNRIVEESCSMHGSKEQRQTDRQIDRVRERETERPQYTLLGPGTHFLWPNATSELHIHLWTHQWIKLPVRIVHSRCTSQKPLLNMWGLAGQGYFRYKP